jgi:serine protease Do
MNLLLRSAISIFLVISISDCKASAEILQSDVGDRRLYLLTQLVSNRETIIDVKSLVPLVDEETVVNPSEIARQITVRIITNPGAGSGIIVARHGKKYTVLTNKHVVSNTWDDRYTVLTADGLSHQAQLLASEKFTDLDLALVIFTSSQNYLVAQTSKSNTPTIGQSVYAAGFPNWYWANSNTPQSTRDWGLQAFKVTSGTVEMVLKPPLLLGYRLGYTNDVKNGMSGGPVIDSHGYLIGINGRLKYPFKGIGSYVFTDGSIPSQDMFLQMKSLSWAILPTIFN